MLLLAEELSEGGRHAYDSTNGEHEREHKRVYRTMGRQGVRLEFCRSMILLLLNSHEFTLRCFACIKLLIIVVYLAISLISQRAARYGISHI